MIKRFKSNRVRILHMLRAIETLQGFGKVNLWDAKDYSATVYQLQVIGEAASKVEASVRIAHSVIPWRSIVGFRHYAVHEYEGVLHDAITQALASLPELKKQLHLLLDTYSDDF